VLPVASGGCDALAPCPERFSFFGLVIELPFAPDRTPYFRRCVIGVIASATRSRKNMTSRARVIRACLSAASVAAVASISATAAAQNANGFSLDRFDPAERGSDWFVLDSLDLRGHKRHAVGDVTEFAYKPLVIYNGDRSERAAVVKLQSFTHIGSSLVLWDRLRVGFNIPVLLWQNGESGNIGATSYKASTGARVGDIRVGSDVRLYGRYRDPLTVSGGLALYLPSGDRASYTGDGKVRISPRVQVAGDVSNFAWAGRMGFNYRAQDDRFANSPMGSEISFALSGGIRAVNKTLLLGPELWGTTGVSDGAFFARQNTPMEVLFGAHYRVNPDMHVDLGFGPGLSRGFGTPLWRFVAAIEWHPAFEPPPPPAPPDRDHDAIADFVDACPDSPGIWTDDPKTNGCPPPPPDRDHDGVVDHDDACLDIVGVATQDPKTNGCPAPPADHDVDGVLDHEDACPDVPGVATQDSKTNGCPPPPPDRDGDTVIDSEDACPDHAGPRDSDPKKNGCPVARVEAGQIRITEQVKFAFGSAKLLPEGDGVLNAVLDVLQKHADITKIRVEGHTDNHGADGLNLQLSKDRAASVMTWLVKHGIDKKRIESSGFGKAKPIDTNDTDAGRQNNRRVEFHIVAHGEQAGAAPGIAKPVVPAPIAPVMPAPKK
jgi:outer membrane protein OmpA-like peptidoglycan-associated protein